MPLSNTHTPRQLQLSSQADFSNAPTAGQLNLDVCRNICLLLKKRDIENVCRSNLAHPNMKQAAHERLLVHLSKLPDQQINPWDKLASNRHAPEKTRALANLKLRKLILTMGLHESNKLQDFASFNAHYYKRTRRLANQQLQTLITDIKTPEACDRLVTIATNPNLTSQTRQVANTQLLKQISTMGIAEALFLHALISIPCLPQPTLSAALDKVNALSNTINKSNI